MLRDVVGNYLDTLSEREFDAPLLAILATHGFTDVHFIHGAFEFGKDVIAKRVDFGILRQYAIQSKAGNLNQASWREVRPQLDEAEYNTLAHPSFDETLPRVAVLVTTGRLTGSAPVDADQYKKAASSRGLADFEVWDRQDLISWICDDPLSGLVGTGMQLDLMAVVTKVFDQTITEPELEQHGRRWLGDPRSVFRACIEAAIIVNALRKTQRLDLAASAALHLFRAASTGPNTSSKIIDSAHRLFRDIATELLIQVEGLLSDPLDIARATATPIGLITYPVVCCRLAELIALLTASARSYRNVTLEARARDALLRVSRQQGTARPVSDWFAASVIAITVVMSRYDQKAAQVYLRSVSQWLLDRHDEEKSGLGLASLHENEERVCARLLGGALESTSIERRNSSYLATAILDLCVFLEFQELYEAVQYNLSALRLIPECVIADEAVALWQRGGPNVWPHPRVEFDDWTTECARSLTVPPGVSGIDALLLASACRSRHYRASWAEI